MKQQLNELIISRNTAINALELLIDEPISNECVFQLPDIIIVDSVINQRPELLLFDYNKEMLDVSKEVKKSQLFPKAFVFTQIGYGNPGLNMLNNEFDDYYIVGASLKWNFWDWNKSRREKQVYAIQKQMISTVKK